MEHSQPIRHLAAGHLAAAVAALAALAPALAHAELDLEIYAALLGEYTSVTSEIVGTRVDYQGLAADARWPQLLASLEAAQPSQLATRDARLAFWLNAYNVLAIRMVIDHYPVDSIRDAGSLFRPVWKREIARIEGRGVTLDQIEHDILRKQGDPRIHGAIVCASTSCPSLAREPYTSDAVGVQLDASMRRWMASPGKGLLVDRTRRRVTLSRIFLWFEDDFEPEGGALAFAARHAPDPDRAWLAAQTAEISVSHFDYDWSLNDWRR